MGETSTFKALRRYRARAKIAINAVILAGAVTMPALAAGEESVTTACDLIARLSLLIRVFGTIVLIVAFAAILYAAVLFMAGGASEEARTKGKTILIWALVGLAVALLATLADDIMIQLLGPVETTCPKPPGF